MDLSNISCLDKLTHLDLQDNSLTDITGMCYSQPFLSHVIVYTAVGSLLCLKWLCLAGNSIQVSVVNCGCFLLPRLHSIMHH